MPDYKKRKRNKFASASKRGKGVKEIESKSNDIKMSAHKENTRKKVDKDLKVVRGTKLKNRLKVGFYLKAVAVVLVIFLCLEFILPAGVFQTARNCLSLIGTGKYPIEFEGANTLNLESEGGYYYLLTDNSLYCFSGSGKELFAHQHGFEKPVLKTSQWGAILYNQGSTSYLIFDLNGLKESFTASKPIITANISHSGSYALVTQADGYESAVYVFNKHGKSLYEWYSSNNIVNNVLISNNSKKIAVTSLVNKNGGLSSNLSILSFKSATPEYTQDYDNVIYNISYSGNSRISVITANKIDFVKWNSFKKTQYSNEYNVSIVKSGNNGTVAVFNRENNRLDNRIAVFSKSGKLKYQVNFNSSISDIQYFGGHIYCISDTEAFILNKEGKVLRKEPIGFGCERFCVLSSNNIAVVSDNKIQKIKLKGVE